MKTWGDFALGAAAGVVIALGIALVTYASTRNVNSEAWLSFAGAIIGTSLAVAGAVWIEERKRAGEVRGQLEMARRALERMLHAHDRLDKLRDLTVLSDENEYQCSKALSEYRQAAGLIAIIDDRCTLQNADFLSALREVRLCVNLNMERAEHVSRNLFRAENDHDFLKLVAELRVIRVLEASDVKNALRIANKIAS